VLKKAKKGAKRVRNVVKKSKKRCLMLDAGRSAGKFIGLE